MKYIKTYERFDIPAAGFAFSKEDSIEDQIKYYVSDITYSDEDYDDCPFAIEY